MRTEITTSMPCCEALSAWLDRHQTYIQGSTPRTYRQYVKVLSEFFHKRPLGEIHIADVRAFQDWRKQTCVSTRVNAELSALQMTMKEADLWAPIARLYRALPVPKTKVRQNMSDEEERRLLAVAFDKPRRRLAGHCLILMANTSMGFGELRHLRRQDVFLQDDPPFIEVNGGTKNDYRIRSIPLNFLALRSMRWIIKRWDDLGGLQGDEYILPHRAYRSEEEKTGKGHARKNPPLFHTPMGHIYRAARGILNAAGLGHLDPYDMRSHAITKLLSDPNVSDQMYTEIVGHVGDAMKRRYSKQRMEKKRIAMDAMCIEPALSEARLIAFPGGKQTHPPERVALRERGRRLPNKASAQLRNDLATAAAQIASEPPYVADEGKASVGSQVFAMGATPRRQTAISPAPQLAGGFYVTSWTW